MSKRKPPNWYWNQAFRMAWVEYMNESCGHMVANSVDSMLNSVKRKNCIICGDENER